MKCLIEDISVKQTHKIFPASLISRVDGEYMSVERLNWIAENKLNIISYWSRLSRNRFPMKKRRKHYRYVIIHNAGGLTEARSRFEFYQQRQDDPMKV